MRGVGLGKRGRQRWDAVFAFGRREFGGRGKGFGLAVGSIGHSGTGGESGFGVGIKIVSVHGGLRGWMHRLLGRIIQRMLLVRALFIGSGEGEGRQFGRAHLAEVFGHAARAQLSEELIDQTEGAGWRGLSGALGLSRCRSMVAFGGQGVEMIDKGDIAGNDEAVLAVAPLISTVHQRQLQSLLPKF